MLKKKILAICIPLAFSVNVTTVSVQAGGVPVYDALKNMYDSMGLGDMGMGMVGTMHRVANVGQQTLGALKASFTSLVNNMNELEYLKQVNERSMDAAPDSQVCVAGAQNSGSFVAARASQATSVTNQQTNQNIAKQSGSKDTQTNEMMRKIQDHACTVEDVEVGYHQCKEPNRNGYGYDLMNPNILYGDTRASDQAPSQIAGGKGVAKPVSQVPLLKRNSEALNVAELQLRRLRGDVPERLVNKSQNMSADGEAYNVKREEYLSRLNTFMKPLEDTKAKTTQMEQKIWNSSPYAKLVNENNFVQVAREVYPDQNIEKLLPGSERLMEELLIKQYMSSVFNTGAAVDKTLDEKAKTRIAALQLKLLWDLNNKIEQLNNNISVLGLQYINPVTRGELENIRNQVSNIK